MLSLMLRVETKLIKSKCDPPCTVNAAVLAANYSAVNRGDDQLELDRADARVRAHTVVAP